jgi:hypothetical protein
MHGQRNDKYAEMHGQQSIIIVLVITFVQAIYNFVYVPETNHVSRV